MSDKWDLLIKNGLIFDGTGTAPIAGDIAIKDGRIIQRGTNLDELKSGETLDATGDWVMPGLVDVHTHYDLEVELTPGLPESVRHGTTTVVISNCSLGLAFGAQRKNGDDPIVSCFARVENMPKHVLKKVADLVDWNDSGAYLSHLETLKLGPNIVPMVPHSMLRIEVMGLDESVSRHPSDDELSDMKSLLKTAMDQGYAGFSTDALPFHFLANDPHRNKQIPTQFAPYKEIKALTSVVRDYDRVWQATPPKDKPLDVLKSFLLTSGRIHKKPLKTTVVAALDVSSNKSIVKQGKFLARILNSRALNGRFYLQALAAPFKIWSDGAFSPLAEEIDEMRELIETDLEDRNRRREILSDPDFQKRFRAMWMSGKEGVSLARVKRKLRMEDYAFDRSFDDMLIENCPIKDWEGQTFGSVFEQYKSGKGFGAEHLDDMDAYFSDIKDEADFMIAALTAFDTDIIWSTVTANRDLKMTRDLLMDPLLLPGFNDSGAHLTNMAFYDCNLRALKIANEGGELDTSYMVKRLTKDVSDIFGVKAGSIEIGDPADITIINPNALKNYDGEKNVIRVRRDEFEHDQLVNRSEDVVTATIIGGKIIWQNNQFANQINQETYGRVLTAGNSLAFASA